MQIQTKRRVQHELFFFCGTSTFSLTFTTLFVSIHQRRLASTIGDINAGDIVAEKLKDLQQFQSQDGAPLQGQRGCYDRAIKSHYILWDDIEAAFPDTNHLLVPASNCFFLIDKQLSVV